MRGILALLVVAVASPASATVLERWDLDELVRRADRIVVGVVGAQRTVRSHELLLTETTVAVERTLLGEPGRTLVLSQLGGRIGVLEAGVVGDARLKPGQRVVLITYLHPDGRRYLVGMAQGAFRIEGETLSQEVGVPVRDDRWAKGEGLVLPPPGRRSVTLPALIAAIARRR